jgi:hypothetical protein
LDTGIATGAFASIPVDSDGTIQDLRDMAAAPPGPVFAPPIPNFILVPGFSFSLYQLPFGGQPPCASGSTVCSPPGSPFVLTQNVGSVSGSLVIRGDVTDLSDNSTAPYLGLFSFNLTNQTTIAQVLQVIQAGGIVESSWSAQLNSIPEPGTWFAMIGAMLLFGGRHVAKRFRR